MNKINFYIIITEYDSNLAKRQPWYSVNKIVKDLKHRGETVKVISTLSNLPSNYEGTVLKVWSLKDILVRHVDRNYRLFFIMNFPIYPISKFLSLPLKVIIENWKDIKRIFIVSLLPSFSVKRSLTDADGVITISDRSNNYLKKFINPIRYFPFIKNNWGGNKKPKSQRRTLTIGYLGPPFTTRGFDDVIKFFVWLNKKRIRLLKKLIIRIERDELKITQDKYIKGIENDTDLKIISGFLTREQLCVELIEVDVLILPFKIVFSELPIVILEALELGITVVSTNDSGICDIGADLSNLCIVDRFNKNSYENILSFISNTQDDTKQNGFEQLSSNMEKINNDTMKLLCKN